MPDKIENPSLLRRLGVFAIHLFVGSFVTTGITMVLSLPSERLFGVSLTDKIFEGPFFIPFVTLGSCLGIWINSNMQSKLAQWVWILPLIWCLILRSDQIRTPGPQGVLHDIWLQYFGNNDTNCGGTECLHEALGTWPLVSSIGYSIGSLAARPLAGKSTTSRKTESDAT